MKTPQTVIRELFHMPAKAYLTLFTVGIGIGVLILALSVSDSFSRNILDKLSKNGAIVTVANATYSAEGGLEPVRPGQFDEKVIDILKSDVSGVTAATAIVTPDWREVTIDGKTYQARRVIGATEDYAAVMELSFVAGNGFTAQDVETGSQKVLVSESVAELLFGKAENALGKTIQPPRRMIRTSNQQEARQVTQNFVITGVFADPDEVKRKAYGVADMVIPYTASFPTGVNMAMIRRFLLNTITLKVEGSSATQAAANIRSALSASYGDDISLHIWEGEPDGTESILTEIRKTVSTFSLVVNLLGFVLLVSGSIGILSIMIVEILAKTRDIAIERALGASKQAIVSEYFSRAVLMSAGSSVIGIAMSLIFSRPLSGLLIPILNSLDIPVAGTAIVSPFAILVGTGSALLTGGIFGTLPIFSSFKAPISESIREG